MARTLRRTVLAIALLLAGNAHAQTYTKTETITYSDNQAAWVLGQVASVTDVSTGAVQSSTSYDPTTALPTSMSAFGKLQSTMTYNADGTLATIKDGLNQTTTLSGWERGIPKIIQYADSTSKSATLNSNGWISSVTDENGIGYTTNYGYDAMGRLSSIVYPTGDTTVWTNSVREFRPLTAADYKPPGIAIGQWRLYEETGNHITITYFDAQWRPLIKHNYDASNFAGSLQATLFEYDAGGRVVFASYPSSDAVPAPNGIWTEYDALDRVKFVRHDSELGVLTTATTYNTGFSTTVTNPRTQSTTTSYLTYDQPTTDWPLTISSPEGAVTTIGRDVFGKPLTLTRSGGSVTPQIRYYAYNSYQELCKGWEPETRGSIYAYDAAGNMTQSAAGLNTVTRDSTNCNADQFGAGRTVVRTYDTRNRVKTLTFPDNKGDQTWNYYNDGLPQSVSTNNEGQIVTNAYTYNRRRLLTGESMKPDAVQLGWGMGYGYNGLGQVVSEAYPASVSVNYTVNALGQTTQVTASSDGGTATTIASAASYFPNGALKQFTYGNGIVHTMTQNTRQLPSRSTDGTVLDLGMAYDANGNVAGVTDYTASARQTKAMIYDGLDRLTSATSPMFGTASYSYDTLDNLKTVVAPGRSHTYNYNTDNNRLLSVTDTVTGSSVIGMNYDLQGNLFNKNGVAFIFDYGNRLRTTAGLTYRYDAEGRRVRQQDAAGSSLKYSYYAKDGRLVWQRDEPGSKRISNLYFAGSLVAEYSRPIGSTTVTVSYLHTDALGSPIAKTNSVGTIVETSEYEPYGKLLNRGNDDRAGYTGHVMDSASGMTYMQQRYYDPLIGRFLSVDPVTAYSKKGILFNRYWYANGNPYKFTDPDGRYVCKASAEECTAVSKAIGELKSSLQSSMSRSLRDRYRLGALVRFLGKEGKANGVVIQAGAPESAGNALTQGGVTTLSINFSGLQGALSNFPGSSYQDLISSTVVHEGSHGLDQRRRERAGKDPMTSSRGELLQGERRAYRNEGIFYRGLDKSSPWLLWTPSGGYNEENIESQAQDSVNQTCASGRCTP